MDRTRSPRRWPALIAACVLAASALAPAGASARDGGRGRDGRGRDDGRSSSWERGGRDECRWVVIRRKQVGTDERGRPVYRVVKKNTCTGEEIEVRDYER